MSKNYALPKKNCLFLEKIVFFLENNKIASGQINKIHISLNQHYGEEPNIWYGILSKDNIEKNEFLLFASKAELIESLQNSSN